MEPEMNTKKFERMHWLLLGLIASAASIGFVAFYLVADTPYGRITWFACVIFSLFASLISVMEWWGGRDTRKKKKK